MVLFLKKDVFTWFKPIIRDYIKNKESDQEEETQKLYNSYTEFEKAIKEAFGNLDEEREAERKL